MQAARPKNPTIKGQISAVFHCQWKDQSWSRSGMMIVKTSLTAVSAQPESHWENNNNNTETLLNLLFCYKLH